MLRYILCKAGFQKSYIQRILQETPPGWHVIETWQPVIADSIKPNILFVVSGSPTQQKEQTVRVRFGAGAAKGAFTVPLHEFRAFLNTFSTSP